MRRDVDREKHWYRERRKVLWYSKVAEMRSCRKCTARSSCVVRALQLLWWQIEKFVTNWTCNAFRRILQIKQIWFTVFLSMFISFLYMFRGTMLPSSGETTVSVRHLVFVILYAWLSGMQEHMLLHTRQSFIFSLLVILYGWRSCMQAYACIQLTDCLHAVSCFCLTYACCCMYSFWTPDDGRKDRPKHVECHSKIK